MSLFRRFRDAAICVALLAIPFLFLNASLKDPSQVGSVDRVLIAIGGPLQYVATRAARGVGAVLEEYFFLVDVGHERDRLGDEVERLREENAALRVHANENRRLRELLELRDRVPGRTIAAQVVAKEVSSFFRVVRIRLDRGEDDAVRAGLPVLARDGLVGQIQRTAGRYSDVLLTVDSGSRVDVVLQRTGGRGMLRGTGDPARYACRLEYLAGNEQAQVGDEVYTSGLGQRFPEGILVGRVSKVVQRQLGRTQEVEVAPAVDFGGLEEVVVLTGGPREEGVIRQGETRELAP